MNQPLVPCPVCGCRDCIECAEEVDIGVGNMRKVTSYECRVCGPVTVCQHCGRAGMHDARCGEMRDASKAIDEFCDRETPF